MGLIVNENKTKYIVMSRDPRIIQNITVGQCTFEQVENFKYLIVNLNNNNDMHNEVRLGLSAANLGYYVYIMNQMFSVKVFYKNTKRKYI